MTHGHGQAGFAMTPFNPHLDPVSWHIQTPRLVIRSLQPGDGSDLQRALSQSFAQIHPWVDFYRTVLSVEQMEAMCCDAFENFKKGFLFDLKATLPDGTFVAVLTCLSRNAEVPSFEVGYWCDSRFAGRGYVTEGMEAVIDFAFDVLQARRLSLHCDALNGASRRVAHKLGFRLEGVLHNEACGPDGNLRDTCVYARFPSAEDGSLAARRTT